MLICVSRVDQALHEFNHLRNVAGRTRLVGRSHAAESVVGPSKCALIAHGEVPVGHIIVPRVMNDLVVYICHVPNQSDVEVTRLEPSRKDVESNAASHVSDMWGCLNGGTTNIDANLPGSDRLKQPHRP